MEGIGNAMAGTSCMENAKSPFWPDFTVGLLASGKLGGQQPRSGEEGRSQSSGDAR